MVYLLILCKSLCSLGFIANGVLALDIPHPAFANYDYVGEGHATKGYANEANVDGGYARVDYYAT